MEPHELDAIKAPLQERRLSLNAKADKLRGELATLDDHLARIDGALAALSGMPPSQAPAKLTRERRKASAPAATKAQVIELLVQELTQRNCVHESELKADIERKLIESGHNRMGYAMRFKEALSESIFRMETDGVSLKRSPQSKVTSTPVIERKSLENAKA